MSLATGQLLGRVNLVAVHAKEQLIVHYKEMYRKYEMVFGNSFTNECLYVFCDGFSLVY